MTKLEVKKAIDEKIAEYKVDLKSPLAVNCEDQINGIIIGLKEARKLVSKITKI